MSNNTPITLEENIIRLKHTIVGVLIWSTPIIGLYQWLGYTDHWHCRNTWLSMRPALRLSFLQTLCDSKKNIFMTKLRGIADRKKNQPFLECQRDRELCGLYFPLSFWGWNFKGKMRVFEYKIYKLIMLAHARGCFDGEKRFVSKRLGSPEESCSRANAFPSCFLEPTTRKRLEIFRIQLHTFPSLSAPPLPLSPSRRLPIEL